MPEFFRERFSVARKHHVCCECAKEIEPGTRYQYISGKWDGKILSYYTCIKCADLRDSLNDVSCPYYSGLYEEYWEYLRTTFGDTKKVRDKFREVRMR